MGWLDRLRKVDWVMVALRLLMALMMNLPVLFLLIVMLLGYDIDVYFVFAIFLAQIESTYLIVWILE